ncbi:MAG: DUF881 domain-containing protein [Armatimonadota bacterium]|nr:DUF881 domain-containing protein [Armatimonadota bacterium]
MRRPVGGRHAGAILAVTMGPFRWRWPAALALFMLGIGFLVAAHVRSRQPLRHAVQLPTWRLQELAVLIRQQEEARRLLEAELDDLRRRVQAYQAALMEGRELTQAMQEEIARYRLVLGLVPVEGPGIRVVLASGPPGTPGAMPAVVEAQDLSALANELWSGGAEAVAINGVRVLAWSAIRQADRAILVDGTRTKAPYWIEAIGDPAALQAALAVRGGFAEGLRAVGVRVAVQSHDRLRLPARPGIEPFRYGRPPGAPQQ